MFRLGFARTRDEAKQIVSHRHVNVNGKTVNIPSYRVKPGDVIEIKENARGSQRYKDIIENTNGRLIPEWLTADADKLSGKVNAIPRADQIDVPVNAVAIVELYSK
jgi:small subunit ribosomal protein S4